MVWLYGCTKKCVFLYKEKKKNFLPLTRKKNFFFFLQTYKNFVQLCNRKKKIPLKAIFYAGLRGCTSSKICTTEKKKIPLKDRFYAGLRGCTNCATKNAIEGGTNTLFAGGYQYLERF